MVYYEPAGPVGDQLGGVPGRFRRLCATLAGSFLVRLLAKNDHSYAALAIFQTVHVLCRSNQSAVAHGHQIVSGPLPASRMPGQGPRVEVMKSGQIQAGHAIARTQLEL